MNENGDQPNLLSSPTTVMGNYVSRGKRKAALPIETTFKLPSPLPAWPPGEGEFAKGSINLGGGFEVCQISSFTKIWATQEGGPDNLGASFFKPSTPLPDGFSMLGCYAQPNNKPLFGWVLVGRDVPGGGTLERPVDYTLIWSSESLNIKQDGHGYFWLPSPPEGYGVVGLLVTPTSEKPSLEEIWCVRSDLTEQCVNDSWIWSANSNNNGNKFDVYDLKPASIGTGAVGVSVGTFTVSTTITTSFSCLKNTVALTSSMPNYAQIEALIENYSPILYFHDDEAYLPSSVTWFFTNGALLYKRGAENTPSPVDPTGSNLPHGGTNDGEYWLDLPPADEARNKLMRGNLGTVESYLHVKPMLGGTFTDIAAWLFYPFNGPARAKVEFVKYVSLGRIGEHVGDWEHVTLRVSNFTGELRRVYFSQHSSGEWVDASQVEFFAGDKNKPVVYSSLHGHASYPKAGLVLEGDAKLGIGIRNDTMKGKYMMDSGERFRVVEAEYLGDTVLGPPWLEYYREWGPKITYDVLKELRKIERFLPGKLRSALERVVSSLPAEVLGEEGPTGPKEKSNWNGDER